MFRKSQLLKTCSDLFARPRQDLPDEPQSKNAEALPAEPESDMPVEVAVVAQIESADNLAPSIRVQSGYSGSIERIVDGQLEGWIADDKLNPVTEPLSLVVNGHLVSDHLPVRYRSDLEESDIANGIAAFSIDISSYLSDSCGSYDISILKMEDDIECEVLGSQLHSKSHRPLLANPHMEIIDSTSFKDWKCDFNYRIGLRLDRYVISKELQKYNRYYSRLSFLEKNSCRDPVILSTQLDLTSLRSTELPQLGVLIRSDRLMDIRCELLKNSEPIASVNFFAEANWRYIEKRFLDADIEELDSDANYKLKFVIPHKGRGYVDIGLVLVAEDIQIDNASLREENNRPEDIVAESVDVNFEFIKNGQFENWSNGIDFNSLKPGAETADSWFFESRANYAHAASLSLALARSTTTNENSDDSNNFGMRIKTGDFKGPVRLLTPLSMEMLNAENIHISMDWAAIRPDSVEEVGRVFLLARGINREQFIIGLSKRIRIRGSETTDFYLNESALREIRAKCFDFPTLLLVIDFSQHSDVILQSVSCSEYMPVVDSQDEPGCAFDELAVAFEDEAITSQLQTLSGIDTWRSTESMEVEEYLKSEDPVVKVELFEIPDIQTPFVGYPTIDIVVPVYNATECVEACIRSVLSKTTVPYRLICIDDGSDQPTADVLDRFSKQFPHVILLRSENNRGYTKSVNRGMQYSNADYVCVLNSDCVVTENWLERLIDCASSAEKTGMVGPLSNAASYQSVPRIYDAHGNWNFNPVPCSMNPEDIASLVYQHSSRAYPAVDVINGFCQLISRELIDEIGYLDEQSFPRGFGEENDYCIRAKKSGFSLKIADDTYVYHKKSQSFGHDQRIDLSKKGTAQLKQKHPNVDLKAMTKKLENDQNLASLRESLTSHGI